MLAKAMQRSQVNKLKKESLSAETKWEMFVLSEGDGVPAAALKFNDSEDTVRKSLLRLKSKLETSC